MVLLLISCNNKNSEKLEKDSILKTDINKDTVSEEVIELPKTTVKIENKSDNDCEILLKDYTKFKDDFVNFMYDFHELDQDNMSEQLFMNYLNQVAEWDEKIKICLSEPKYSSRIKQIQKEIEKASQ
jgi:hypothetical protein